jgi:hypothetical protein
VLVTVKSMTMSAMSMHRLYQFEDVVLKLLAETFHEKRHVHRSFWIFDFFEENHLVSCLESLRQNGVRYVQK